MRVTLVSRIYFPEPAAASFRLGALVRGLSQGGDDVTVLTTTYRPSPAADPEAANDGPGALDAAEVSGASTGGSRGAVRVRRRPVLRDRAGYVRGYLPYLSFDVPAFFRLLCSRRPDVVVVEPPPTTGVAVRLACALRRVPYIYYAADVWSDASQTTGAAGIVVRVLRGVEAWVWRGAAAVLAVSGGVAERVQRYEPRASVVIVGNGIDTDVFRPAAQGGKVLAPGAKSAPDDHASLDPYLVYAGTASEWHGAEVFVEAMREVHRARPDARLVFVGQGAHWDRLAAAARTLPDGVVQLHPRVDGAAAASWLRGARASLASVLSGTPYEFAFPTKAYASMACGTPVVYAGAGTAGDEILDSGSGWAVPHDVVAVAAAMLDALEQPPSNDARQVLSDWATEHVSISAAAARAGDVIRSQRPRGAGVQQAETRQR